MPSWLILLLAAIAAVALFVVGMSLTLMFKGHFIDSEISTNKNMQRLGIKCAVQEPHGSLRSFRLRGATGRTLVRPSRLSPGAKAQNPGSARRKVPDKRAPGTKSRCRAHKGRRAQKKEELRLLFLFIHILARRRYSDIRPAAAHPAASSSTATYPSASFATAMPPSLRPTETHRPTSPSPGS